ncbi:MAG: PAS domain-containing protein [Rhizobacter sp.]|nr:PAS domain-containing protein [Rhizobacter sp.]
MPPAPLPADESHRLARLHATGILDTQPEASFDTIAQCAAELTGCPIAVISLLDASREWFKAVHGWDDLPVREIPRAISFCNHTLTQDGPFEVSDATHDPRFAHNPFVTGVPHIRAYAGAPLIVDGVHLGALCVVDTRVHTLTDTQRSSLVRLAHVASEMLKHQRTAPPADDERARLLDFARASGDWMWETDAELRYTWVSSTFEAVTGLSPFEMKGRPLEDSPLLDNLGQPLGQGRRLHALLQRRQPITRVIADKPTPRGTLQVSRSAVPVFDAHGVFTGYRGTARDVSAHIAAERRTHAQAELLRKLSSQVPGVIYQLWLRPDGSMRYTYASDATREVFGVEPPHNGDGGGEGRDATLVCRMLHPDDEPEFMPSLLAASQALQPWQREFRIIRDGTLRWIETRAVPERHPEGGTLWHGFCSDVTARKEIELALRSSEERWGLAAEAAGIGIAELDLASGRMSFDARACANHGLRFPLHDYHLSDWLGAIHPDDRAGVQARLDQALAGGGMLEVRYRLQRPDGGQATLEIFARCTLGDAGRPIGMVGTCRDVTQQAAHEQLRSDKESAERASRAKSEFLSRVSHELRTPLNGILGFAQLMAIDRVHPLEPDQARRLDSVLRAGRHLLDLINDMLNLARIEQEDFSLQRTPVNLAATLQTCFTLIQPMADSAGVRLAAPPRRAHWALADARAVEQVLLNLLSNAIKYNRPAGTVKVTLSRGDEHIHVAVSDEGEGLSEAQQAHLFQPFNRLGAEQKRVEGTGLGLVIARELAASMGGELKVASVLGKGSTFTLRLPAGAAPSGTRHRADTRDAMPPEPPSAHRQVLYVEDEPLNVLLMQEVFKSRPQWELQIATDGQGGLAAARTQQHDLLLIDMNLPDMSGLELIRALRADPRTAGLQCIALSADAMQAQIDAALAAGFDGYWTKPINVAHMLDGLGQALEK